MTFSSLTSDDATVPKPLLFNTWKHHAGTIRRKIQQYSRSGQVGLPNLAKILVVLGSDVMDLYLGDLTPSQIAEEVLSQLQSEVIHSQNAYQNWVKENGGFRMVSISRDESQWVLRMGEEPGRFIHLHPGRNSPRTRRVRANTLRTAILVCAYLQVEPRPLEVSLVNQVRQQYLGLSPVGKMKGEEGLVSVIKDLLK